ncbi:MAG TPA: hypothetical protein DCF97_03655, partial [Plesiomonas shigelloides]|nr:hypothetical protein [Plesiomonas shigelloides]
FKPYGQRAALSESVVVDGPVGEFELLLCHRDLILNERNDQIRQILKSSIYSTKPRSVELHEKVIGAFIEKYMFY